MYLINPDGQEHYYMVTLTFKVIKNEAEYEALMTGLRVAHQMGVTELEVKGDSQLVVNQVLGLYATKGEKMKKYLAKVWELCDCFSHFNIIQIL